jgi:hypothetical protein
MIFPYTALTTSTELLSSAIGYTPVNDDTFERLNNPKYLFVFLILRIKMYHYFFFLFHSNKKNTYSTERFFLQFKTFLKTAPYATLPCCQHSLIQFINQFLARVAN